MQFIVFDYFPLHLCEHRIPVMIPAAVEINVITSYSIHYTKLYDPQGYSLVFSRIRKSVHATSNDWISDYKNGWLEISANSELFGQTVVRN